MTRDRMAEKVERKRYETCNYCYVNRVRKTVVSRKNPKEWPDALNKSVLKLIESTGECVCSPQTRCRDHTCYYFDPDLAEKFRVAMNREKRQKLRDAERAQGEKRSA